MSAYKLAASNIGWIADNDDAVLELMAELGFVGLEVAPTRIVSENPYVHYAEAEKYAVNVKKTYGLEICSMQSIWFGRSESLFDREGAAALLAHTKRAIDFASAMECPNLVFGCPKNRAVPEGASPKEALEFFRECGDYANQRGVVIALEANPPIYETNFMNTTAEALSYVKEVACAGIGLNLDLGAVVANEEPFEDVANAARVAHHVHISEPGLVPLKRRELHEKTREVLENAGYVGFVSAEMAATDFDEMERCLRYVEEAFS